MKPFSGLVIGCQRDFWSTLKAEKFRAGDFWNQTLKASFINFEATFARSLIEKNDYTKPETQFASLPAPDKFGWGPERILYHLAATRNIFRGKLLVSGRVQLTLHYFC